MSQHSTTTFQGSGSNAGALTHSRYVDFWKADRGERIRVVEAGVPASFIAEMAEDMAVPTKQVCGWLGLSPSAAARLGNAERLLAPMDGERVLGMARLVGQVQTIVDESGNSSGFDAAKWTAAWLLQPHPALGGKAPADFVQLIDGQRLVSTLLGRAQSGAYS